MVLFEKRMVWLEFEPAYLEAVGKHFNYYAQGTQISVIVPIDCLLYLAIDASVHLNTVTMFLGMLFSKAVYCCVFIVWKNSFNLYP